MKHISTTITLAVVCVTTTLLLADAAIFSARESDQHELDARHANLALAGSVARLVQSLVEVGHADEAASALASVASENGPVAIRWRARMPLRRSDQFTEGGWLHTHVPVPGAHGSVTVEQSVRPLESFRRHALTRAVVMALLLSIFCALAIHLTTRFVIRKPLVPILERLRQIGDGHLDAQLGLTRRDELGTIARRVDEMSAALSKAADERAASETERAAARAQIEHSNRLATVGRLAAGMAHELGTPLNIVLLRSRMIERDGPPGSEQAVGAAQITRQVERITSILQQLLRYARPRKPERQQADLAQLTRTAVEMLQPMAAAASVTLEITAPDVLYASADPGQFEQVLVNLIQNAIQALPEGGKVHVSLDHEDDGDLALHVDDSGDGVEEALRPLLFDPFFTTKQVGQGTGLGLSMVHGIVREHGGTIEVEDAPLGGARFAVKLPNEQRGGEP